MKTSEQYENEGVGLLSRGEPKTALEVFEEGLRLHPGDTGLQLGAGMANNDLGNFARACELLEPLRKKHPTHGDVLQGLAAAYLHLGRTSQALDCIGQALGPHETDAEFIHNLGLLLYANNLYTEAIRVFNAALQRQKDFEEAYLHIGFCLLKLGKIPEAIGAVIRATEVHPKFWPAFSVLGNLLYDEGDKAGSRATWLKIPDTQFNETETIRRFLELLPEPEFHSKRARLTAQLQKLEPQAENFPRVSALSAQPAPGVEFRFWRGFNLVMPPKAWEIGVGLEPLLVQMFETPGNFEDNQAPVVKKINKSVAAKYLKQLAKLLLLRFAKNHRGTSQITSEMPKSMRIGDKQVELNDWTRSRGAINLLIFSDFGNQFVYARAIIKDLLLHIDESAMPYVAFAKLREGLQHVEPHIPRDSEYHKAWTDLWATLEPDNMPMKTKKHVPSFVSIRLDVRLTWVRTKKINPGHGISFIHDGCPNFEVAYVDGYLRRIVNDEIRVEIVTATPRNLARPPQSAAESELKMNWSDIVAEVREAVASYLASDIPRPNKIGRVKISIGG